MNTPLIIAHRGASEHARDNSLDAFLLAAKQGAQMIEMDVRATRDQVLVLHHNNRLKLSKPKLKIASMTYQELKETGYTFPTLKEVLSSLPENILINLDLKDFTMDLALKSLITDEALERRIYFDTSNPFILQRYQVFFPHASYVYSSISPWDPLNLSSTFVGDIVRFLVAVFLYFPLRFRFNRKIRKTFTNHVSLYSRLCHRRDVEFYHSLGIGVFVFTLNKEDSMRKFIDMGVDGIKTNNPELLARVVSEMRA